MRMTARDRVVCFDLGGVIVRICRTFEEGLAAAGVPARHEGPDWLDAAAFRAAEAAYQTGELDDAAYYAAASAATGRRYDISEIRRVHHHWIRGPYPGVRELLVELAASGMVTAALSNTNAAHWRQLEVCDAFRAIRHRHASHLIGLAKPDPAIFAWFERALGVPGECILYFDDLEPNVAAAAARGWSAHRIDHRGDTAAQIRQVLAASGWSRG